MKNRLGDLGRGGVKVCPRFRLQSNVLTCKLVRLGRPADSGNCRRSPPKTSIPAATSGRPPVRQSALPSDHFGKGCSRVVPRFFRCAPVAVEQTDASFTFSWIDTRVHPSSFYLPTGFPISLRRSVFSLSSLGHSINFWYLCNDIFLIKILLLFRSLNRAWSSNMQPDNVRSIYVCSVNRHVNLYD